MPLAARFVSTQLTQNPKEETRESETRSCWFIVGYVVGSGVSSYTQASGSGTSLWEEHRQLECNQRLVIDVVHERFWCFGPRFR